MSAPIEDRRLLVWLAVVVATDDLAALSARFPMTGDGLVSDFRGFRASREVNRKRPETGVEGTAPVADLDVSPLADCLLPIAAAC